MNIQCQSEILEIEQWQAQIKFLNKHISSWVQKKDSQETLCFIQKKVQDLENMKYRLQLIAPLQSQSDNQTYSSSVTKT